MKNVYHRMNSHRSIPIGKGRFSFSKNNSHLSHVYMAELSLVVVYMVVTISRLFRLLVMVKLGESIVHDKCISQEELAQIDRHRQKSIFFLQKQLPSSNMIGASSIASIQTTRTNRCKQQKTTKKNQQLSMHYQQLSIFIHPSLHPSMHSCIHTYVDTYKKTTKKI